MRWISDMIVKTAVAYFSGRNNKFNYETLLFVGSILLRRTLFLVFGSLVCLVLAVGGLFMLLVDLGDHLNAFGNMGLSYSGGIGLTLLGISLLALFFVSRSPIKLKEHEMEVLRSQQGSMGEMIMAGLIEKVQGLLQPQPAPAPQPQAQNPIHKVPVAPEIQHRPIGNIDLKSPVANPMPQARDWSAYTN